MTQEAQHRVEAQTVIHLLRSDAYASRQLKELVSTPLFLTLLCIVVAQGGQIPEHRAEFFRECLRVYGAACEPIVSIDLPPSETIRNVLQCSLNVMWSDRTNTYEFHSGGMKSSENCFPKQTYA